MKLWKGAAAAVIVGMALTACGGDDESTSSSSPAVASTTTSTTTATTSVASTTERATTTTVCADGAKRSATSGQQQVCVDGEWTLPTTSAPPTTVDPLTAAGFPPDPQIRQALRTMCDAFTERDAEAMNGTLDNEEGFLDLLTDGFGVLCPENVALVGVAVMGNGEPVFAGFPLIVDVSTIDSRVANAFEGNLVDGQVVALAPGVYTPFNPAVPELWRYLDGPNDGDCVMRDTYFPHTGGSCWNGVQKGSAEP